LEKTGTGGVAQVVECLPSKHEAEKRKGIRGMTERIKEGSRDLNQSMLYACIKISQ
jgi:hypothetical protein